jgi:hypothetical protein
MLRTSADQHGRVGPGPRGTNPQGSISLKSDLRHFRCKLTPPKTPQVIEILWDAASFTNTRETVSPNPGHLTVTAVDSVTSPQFFYQSAPKVRKIRFKCSATAGFATAAFDNGVPEFKISQQTGHKTSRMLEKYIRSEQKARQEAASSLGL